MRAEQAASSCECFVVVGTSAVVYPAAGLVTIACRNKAHVIEINVEETPASELAKVSLLGPSGQILPELIRRL